MARRINSRAKGASGEREFIEMLAQHIGEHYQLKRNLEQTRSGGHDINGLDGWAIEVKRHRTPSAASIKQWWNQAVEQANGRQPLLAYRGDRQPWRIVVSIGALHPAPDNQFYSDTIEMAPCLFARLLVKDQ